MKYDVTIKFKNGHKEVFTITTKDPDELVEKTTIMALENFGYWFDGSYVDCYEVRTHKNENE